MLLVYNPNSLFEDRTMTCMTNVGKFQVLHRLVKLYIMYFKCMKDGGYEKASALNQLKELQKIVFLATSVLPRTVLMSIIAE